jgi:hypothetical protein
MARSYTIAQIRQRIRKKADMISSTGFFPDSDVLDLINERYGAFYDVLVGSYANYFATTGTQVLTPGTSTYALPADFYKLISCDRDNGNGTYTSIFPYQELERNSSLYSSANQIPNATVRYRYIPQPTIFTLDTQSIDGIAGWESILILECAIAMKNAEESDTSGLERELEREYRRLQTITADRDVTMPGRVTDVSVYDNAYIRDALRYHLFGNNIEFILVQYVGI